MDKRKPLAFHQARCLVESEKSVSGLHNAGTPGAAAPRALSAKIPQPSRAEIGRLYPYVSIPTR